MNPAITSTNNDVGLQREQLSVDLLKKELEISKIGKEIEEQEKILESMYINCVEVIANIFKKLNECERKKFTEKLSHYEESFHAAFFSTNIKNFLLAQIFNQTTDHPMAERVKSLLTRRFVEREILRSLMLKYENALQEMSEINAKLVELNKSMIDNTSI